MRAVVDTNVIAYFLLGTEPFREECIQFWAQLRQGIAPASWQAELTNVLWLATRHDSIDLPTALHRLEIAKTLKIHSVPATELWQGALIRADAFGVSAYDTLFVELAAREGIALATFDQAVLRAFPDLAARPGSLAA